MLLPSNQAIRWTPVISPGDVVVYRGEASAGWRGNPPAAGVSSQAIVRMELDHEEARGVGCYDMAARICSIEEGPGGALWVLVGGRRGSQGRRLRLTSKN